MVTRGFTLLVVGFSVISISPLTRSAVDKADEKVLAGHPPSKTHDRQSDDGKQHNDHDYAKKIYTALFTTKRRDHEAAVLRIQAFENGAHQKEALSTLFTAIKLTMVEAKKTIESLNRPPQAPFPLGDGAEREALAHVVENAAFASDLTLHFSRLYQRDIQRDKTLMDALRWAFDYALKSSIFDETTHNKVTWAGQLLGFLESPPDFKNPYEEDERDLAREAYEEFEEARREREKQRKSDRKLKKPKQAAVDGKQQHQEL